MEVYIKAELTWTIQLSILKAFKNKLRQYLGYCYKILELVFFVCFGCKLRFINLLGFLFVYIYFLFYNYYVFSLLILDIFFLNTTQY